MRQTSEVSRRCSTYVTRHQCVMTDAGQHVVLILLTQPCHCAVHSTTRLTSFDEFSWCLIHSTSRSMPQSEMSSAFTWNISWNSCHFARAANPLPSCDVTTSAWASRDVKSVMWNFESFDRAGTKPFQWCCLACIETGVSRWNIYLWSLLMS